MEIKQLKHFVEVYETGNLSRASLNIHLSQPALTRSIRNLEFMLRTTLFDRKPRGMIPTQSGKALYKKAKLILAECNRAVEEMAAVEAGTHGHIDIGIGALFSATIIDQIVCELSDQFPSVSLTVEQGYFEELVSALLEGRLDVVFTTLPLSALPDGLEFEPLMEVRSSIIMSANHSLASKAEISGKDLSQARWATVNQQHALDSLEQLFLSSDVPMSAPVVRSNSLKLLTELVKSGDFVSILPEHLVSRELAEGSIQSIETPPMPIIRKAGLIYRKSKDLSQIVQRFIDAMRTSCGTMVLADAAE